MEQWKEMLPPPLPMPFVWPTNADGSTVSYFQIAEYLSVLDIMSHEMSSGVMMHQLADIAVADALFPYIDQIMIEQDEIMASAMTEQLRAKYGVTPFQLHEFRTGLGIHPARPAVPFYELGEATITVCLVDCFYVGQPVSRGPHWNYPDHADGTPAEGFDPSDPSNKTKGYGVIEEIDRYTCMAKVNFPFAPSDQKSLWCEIGRSCVYLVVPRPLCVVQWPQDRRQEEVMSMKRTRDDAFEARVLAARTPRKIASRVVELSAAAQAKLAERAQAVPLPPDDDDDVPREQQQQQQQQRRRDVRRTDASSATRFFSQRAAMDGEYRWTRWTDSQLTAADRLRLAKERDFANRSAEAIAAAASQNNVVADLPKMCYVPLEVISAALGFEHGKVPTTEAGLQEVKDVQFFEPHRAYFDGDKPFSVAWRESYPFASVDALVASSSPFRRKFMIDAAHIYVVQHDVCTWVLCAMRREDMASERAIKDRCSFKDARPKNAVKGASAASWSKTYIVQTMAKAPTVKMNGKELHDPSTAALAGSINTSGVNEYLVPEGSDWWKALAKTPHTRHSFDHVIGADTRPMLSVKFPSTVSFVMLHNLLVESKIEGRITRWGTILCPSLTTEAGILFKSHGGDLPKEQIERRAKAKAAAKAKEVADRIAADKATAERIAAEKKEAEARRQAEIDRLPAKILVTAVSHPFLSLKYIADIQAAFSTTTIKRDSKFLSNDVKTMVFAVSADTAVSLEKQTLRIGKDLFCRVHIDPSMFFRSKFAADAADGATRNGVSEAQVVEDAATLAGVGSSSSSDKLAATPQRGADE
jgi:hypothetical protein